MDCFSYYCVLFYVVAGFVFFNRLNFLNDLNGLNFFKSASLSCGPVMLATASVLRFRGLGTS